MFLEAKDQSLANSYSGRVTKLMVYELLMLLNHCELKIKIFRSNPLDKQLNKLRFGDGSIAIFIDLLEEGFNFFLVHLSPQKLGNFFKSYLTAMIDVKIRKSLF